MLCKYCGTTLKEGASFCHQCGQKVEAGVAASQAETPNVSEPAVPLPVDYNQIAPQYVIPEPEQKDNSGFAIASLVLGIVSIVVCCCGINLITAILAIIFGVLGLRSSKKGLAIAGIITAAVSIFFLILLIILYFIGIFEANAEMFDFNNYMYF